MNANALSIVTCKKEVISISLDDKNERGEGGGEVDYYSSSFIFDNYSLQETLVVKCYFD